jgi:hypothetical protein
MFSQAVIWHLFLAKALNISTNYYLREIMVKKKKKVVSGQILHWLGIIFGLLLLFLGLLLLVTVSETIIWAITLLIAGLIIFPPSYRHLIAKALKLSVTARVLVAVVLIIGGILVSTAVFPDEDTKPAEDFTAPEQPETQPVVEPEPETETDPVLKRANPYLDKIVLEDIGMRSQAASYTAGCPHGDKECQISSLYRYVVNNYEYYSDPRTREFIQSPAETIQVKGGDCEDTAILLISLLENLGTKTYMVFTEDHAYALACDINMDSMTSYSIESLKEKIIESWQEDYGEDATIITDDGELFVESKPSSETVVIDPNYTLSWGTGDPLPEDFEYLNIMYTIDSSEPLDIYFFPTEDDFQDWLNNTAYDEYVDCRRQNILSTSSSCDELNRSAKIVFSNTEWQEADVYYELIYRFKFSSTVLDPSLEETKLNYYTLGDQKCIVLDPSAGAYAYAGFDANVTGEKVAVDPVTREYYYLS